MVWSQVCDPTCSSWVLGSSGVSVAPFCRLSLWQHPLLLFSRWGFLLGRLSGLGLVGCDPAWVPAFFWGNSPSPVRGFRWAVPAVWLSRLLVFSWSLYLGSFLSLPVFAAGLRWFRLIPGCPPSVAWRWRLLRWFFVRYLSACPRGATVPLDSLVLWYSWSFPSCGVPCLRLSLWAAACIGPGGCPAFSRVGPAPLSWVPLLWTWLVWEASTVFLLHCLPSGCGHPLGSIMSFVTIANEDFHGRYFLVRCSFLFRGCVVVFLRPL